MHIPNIRKPRTTHRSDSGLNHVRYDHKQRPTKLDVVCPRCQSCAIAIDSAFNQGRLIIGDTSPTWHKSEFSIICTKCMYRAKDISYEELTEPFHQISISGRTLWAWNIEHLEMILFTLQGRNISKHPYGFFVTYIHRGWMQWRIKFAKEIERHIQVNNS